MGDVPVPPHPSMDKLRQFGLGQLDGPEASTIEAHVAHCDECGRTLMDVGTDTFIAALRAGDRQAPLDGATIALPDSDLGSVAPDGSMSSPGAGPPRELAAGTDQREV